MGSNSRKTATRTPGLNTNSIGAILRQSQRDVVPPDQGGRGCILSVT